MNLVRASAVHKRLLSVSAIVTVHSHRDARFAGFYTAILDTNVPKTAPNLVHAPNHPVAVVPAPSNTDHSGRGTIAVPTASLHRSSTKTSTSNYQSEVGIAPSSSNLVFAEPAPAQPDPPDNCCMSGCIHCVWNLYVDDYLDFKRNQRAWHGRRFKWIQAQLAQQEGPKLEEAIERQLREWMAMDAERMVDPPSAEAEKREALAVMDPTVRMFWEMENKLNNT